jgi:phage shock protein PspC (stress-responsive transcriptional regulator)
MTENSATDQSAFSTPYDDAEDADDPAYPAFDAAGLAERYGIKQGMSRTRKITLGAFGFALLCGVAGYIAWNQAHPQIQGTVISYNVSSTGNAITVTFEVDKSANDAAECTVQAEDVQGNVIGSANVAVPSGRSKEDMVYTVNTTGTPNTAVVSSCTEVS